MNVTLGKVWQAIVKNSVLRIMQKPKPITHACPNCGTSMKHVRTIANLAGLPEIQIFY